MLPTSLVGARTHNLAGVSVTLSPGEVVVVTGVSGAGKSSLAMDTLYAEGQRRFVESFSPYARQFLERLERPPVTSLEPVPAGIAVDCRAPVKSSRSTVATMADLEPYLSALFTREAVAYCPEHDVASVDLDASTAAARVVTERAGERVVASYRLYLDDADEYLEARDRLVHEGYRRLWVDGAAQDIDAVKPSQATRTGRVDVVVDRIDVRAGDKPRLSGALEEAWGRGMGVARFHSVKGGQDPLVLRRGLACPECARPTSAPVAGLFSYESPLGACPACRGFGRTIGVDLDKVIPNHDLSLSEGAIRPWSGKSATWERGQLAKFCRRKRIPLDRPFRALSASQRALVLSGDGDWDEGRFPGVAGWFEWLETRTYKMHVRVFLSRYRSYDPCADCGGKRLNDAALSYRVGGANIAAWHSLEIRAARANLATLETTTGQGELARRELESRLAYLERVGLSYLTLDRQARTLSGGEAQRVTLTAALGTSLHNALFVLDEPSVGLHPSDVAPLGEVIRELAARNNAVLVVEHDPALIANADRVIELGPGAGRQGGRVVADGPPAVLAKGDGATARALRPRKPRQTSRRTATSWIGVRSATANNLREVDASIPLGVLCAVTGPSGSGKSSLVVGVLYRALARRLGAYDVDAPGAHERIEGAERVRRVSLVDQSPLGRTSRGNAATYTKAWDTVRKILAAQAKEQGLALEPRHFSFNVDGGRCDACNGDGHETVEMQFLADVRLVCPACQGRRFKDHVLAVDFRGRNVAQLLELTVDEAIDLFRDRTAILRALGPAQKLGLGYLTLGQSLSTLSGGEAQRLKIARALGEDLTGSLLILDEPSAGLHADEVDKVLGALDVIVDAGGSVVVVEHDLDVISHADWVIDLGPGAGREGGRVVVEGTPETIAKGTGRTAAALRERPRPRVRGKPRRSKKAARPVLTVERAREHNLRDVSVEIPHGALTVVTGPSGSGKSTLAFDVVFAEGQRRFLETLTPYARQFLPTMPRPDVDSVSGVPPAIALEQRSTRAGSKSTVATVTEVAHYLRLIYAKLGVPHCPDHGAPITSTTLRAVIAAVRSTPGRVDLLAPVVEARKGTYLDVFTAAAREGIEAAVCDGRLVSTDDPPRLAKSREHDIHLVIAKGVTAKRVSDEVVEGAIRWGNGSVVARRASGAETRVSMKSACPECGLFVPELDPRYFSFNTAQGRCERCSGEGTVDPTRRRRGRGRAAALAPRRVVCPECQGSRLAPLPRAVELVGDRYHETTALSVAACLKRVRSWRFAGDAAKIAGPVVQELERRLSFLADVGLDYLALDRAAKTLSGGEMQRLRLAAQLGAGLTGALYVLDEPTIGLHPRDTGRLLNNLRELVRIGSTVVVVEHDVDTIRAADHLVDLGPGGGSDGGEIVASGPPRRVLAKKSSPTARALAAPLDLRDPRPVTKRDPHLVLTGASENNLKGVDLRLPLGRFTVVAGVSGSGKSTLIRQVLLPAVRARLDLAADEPGAHDDLSGFESLRRAVSVDQSPIGRTPRSVPATFLGIWNSVRALFAATPEAQMAGFAPARFSFNTPAGGRCKTCEGQGVITHEMSFLPDVVSRCPTCEGQRFEPRTLAIRYLERSVGEVLDLTADEGAYVFRNHPQIAAPLRTLTDLGAGYIKIGQGSHTLSGGEAQRLKLATELTASRRHEPTLYVLDEPTTGLHLADVSKLMAVLDRLVERGDSLAVIEHHPVVMAGADWLVELGPDGGERGGRIVAAGPPRTIARRKTATGRVLDELYG